MDELCDTSTEFTVSRKYVSSRLLKKNVKKYKTLWISVVVAVFLFAVVQNYTLNLFTRAVLKLTIMQLLDLNNFKNLLYDSCLMYKQIPRRELSNSDCYTCEIIDHVDLIHNPEVTLESFAELDWPVAYKSDIITNISVKDIAFTLLTGDFLPCDYESNLKIDPRRAIEIKTGWFMHWRNCDDVEGKIIRSLYRPDSFLSTSPETWTIMSFKYKTVHFKKINVYYNSRVAVSQIRGTCYYQLVPKSPCTTICKFLNGHLETNHVLIFSGFIWDFQYLPSNSSAESISVIHYLD